MPKHPRTPNATQTPNDAAIASQAIETRLTFAWWTAALLAIVVATIYGNQLDAPFIFDDYNSIQTNDTITSIWPLWTADGPRGPLNTPRGAPTTARPVVNLSFALNYWFGELDPTGYRCVNVALHIGSAILLGAIVRRTLQLPYFESRFDGPANWLSMAVAFLWALHPLQTEAVVYATQRTELMMAFFYLATLYCSLRYWEAHSIEPCSNEQDRQPALARRLNGPSSAWLILATFACLAGMGSKEVMVSAPLLVLLFERTFVSGSLATALRRSWPLYCGLACGWLYLLWLHMHAPHQDSAGFNVGVSGLEWWLTQTKVLLMYMKLVIWPWPLVIHYDMPYLNSLGKAWIYVVPVALAGLVTLWLLWRNHPAGFLGTAVFAILSPTLVVPLPTEIAAERRMYLALAAVATLVVVGGYDCARRLVRGFKRPREFPSDWTVVAWSLAAAVVVVAVAYSAVSVRRLRDYDNELGLWQQVVRLQPDNYLGHLNTGAQWFNAGNISEAMKHYRQSHRLKPDSSQVHYNIGLAHIKLNQPQEAAKAFAEAVRLQPGSSRLLNNLGVALYMAGRNDESIQVFQKAIEVEPTMWRAHDNLGTSMARSGRFAEAIKCHERALQIHPKALDVYAHLADAQAKSHQTAAAITTVERALQLARELGDFDRATKIDAQLAAYRATQGRLQFRDPAGPATEPTQPTN